MSVTRRALLALATGLAVTMAAGCSRTGDAPVRIGVLVWPPYEMAYLARHLGYFDDRDVQIVEFSAPADLFRAYLNGAVDAAPMTSQFLLYALQNGADHSAALLIDYSNGGDALVAKPHIGSIGELAGRTIAMESGTLGAYLLERTLDAGGLTRDEVRIEFVDIPDQEAAFERPQIDAVVTYEPTVTRLRNKGGRVLFDSSRIPLEIIDVMIVRRDALRVPNDKLHKLVDGWLRARDYYEQQPRKAAALVAGRHGLSVDAFVEAMGGVAMPDRAANLRLLGGHDRTVLDALGRQMAFMIERGTLEQPVDYAAALDASLVRALPR